MDPLAVFVYGTLRPGGWNHDAWLAPFLVEPCHPAAVLGLGLHLVDGVPCVVPDPESAPVLGEVAVLDPARYDDGLARLDELEEVAAGLYRRERWWTATGEPVWLWVAGPAVAGRTGPATAIASGDWFDLAPPG